MVSLDQTPKKIRNCCKPCDNCQIKTVIRKFLVYNKAHNLYPKLPSETGGVSYPRVTFFKAQKLNVSTCDLYTRPYGGKQY